MSASAPPSTYNILFLGEVLSGKSTLIEHLKKYADPGYTVNCKNIGDGVSTCTTNVSFSQIQTDTPEYFITYVKTGERVDYGEFIKEVDQENYEDQLNERKKYNLVRDDSAIPNVTFNLIDTPGLNHISLSDENNIAIILKALASIESINLVVITIANSTFTASLVDALKTYVGLWPEFNGNLVFVHTKIDYAKLHDTKFADTFFDKKSILGKIVGRDSVPHLLIDNNIGNTQIVRDCITQNTLRNLLRMAKLNQSVPIRTMRMNKTEKMRLADSIVMDNCETNIQVLMKILRSKSTESTDTFGKIGDLIAEIVIQEQQLHDTVRDLSVYDRDTLELLHEELYQQDFSMLNMTEASKTVYYPGKKRATEPGFIHHLIDHVDYRIQNVKVQQEAGGPGEAFWAVNFRMRKRQNGVYHVKIYITRKKKFAAEIEQLKAQKQFLRGILAKGREDLQAYTTEIGQLPDAVQQMLNELEATCFLQSRVRSNQVDSKVLRAALESGAYVRDIAASARNIERFYLDNRLTIESLETSTDFVVSVPINTSDYYISAGEELDIPNPTDTSIRDFNRIMEQIRLLRRLRPQEDLKYSVVTFGKTQAGKSTFIQFVKKYFDPEYDIEWELIGNRCESKTGKPEQFVMESGLPSYEVYLSNDNTMTPINLNTFGDSCDDMDDYPEALHRRGTTVRRVPQDPKTLPPQRVEITFLDTPGIEDTNGQDEKHAKAIIERIIELGSVNLIVVVVNSKDHPSNAQRLAYDYYSKVIHMLQGHISNVLFLYTNVEYKHCHHSNKSHHATMEKRHELFSSLFRGFENTSRQEGSSGSTQLKPFRKFTIDFDKGHRDIPKCMMMNTLKDIVKLAMESPHVRLDNRDENLKRVWAIKHPDKDNNEVREKLQSRLPAETAVQQQPDAVVLSGEDVAECHDFDETEDFEVYFKNSVSF
ncbi:hypothetical protein MVEG_04170 [Podila verticillata NRRL 6337]|nr:hypothetical protein MVEG_04170 [Podila verticillata NRRL 6337]